MGQQPWIAADKNGVYAVWVENRDEKLLLARNSGDLLTIGSYCPLAGRLREPEWTRPGGCCVGSRGSRPTRDQDEGGYAPQ